ncbi:MAG TPA: thiamine pyrophosphate-binding protein [Streptosporangiaceae bacterium]|jgi:benzoylformate decarboxylase|nr:thiamine pyrophosphate-binding protein [Streptosporangiaceae bacterium]
MTVREATLDVARQCGLTTWFGNPGSTEIPLLAGLPADIRYVLALHESAAAGMACGYALGTGRPALVSLHTAAGLGNAVSTLATARTNRAPLVVLVGQQDRRHLLADPFLTGRLDGLAGSYPLQVFQPPRAQDVPGCLAQAWHAAALGQGPVLVIVPMGDWDEPAEDLPVPAPLISRRAAGVAAADVADIAGLLRQSSSPVLVTGPGAASTRGWSALTALADRLGCPAYHETFLTAQPGFPQDHPRFAGFLPAGRAALRATLAPHDAVLVAGAALLRQYHYEPGPLVEPGTRVAVISADPAEVQRSPADIGLVAPVAAAIEALAAAIPGRAGPDASTSGPAAALRAQRDRAWQRAAAGLTPEAVFAALAEVLPADAVVVEECPSSREALQLMLPARHPLGYLGLAMGGLGFGMPAAAGLRMARPDRPVVAIIGDGSAAYCYQTLWTAARQNIRVPFLVLANRRYQVMDDMTAARGAIPWPRLDGLSADQIAVAQGVRGVRVTTREQLTEAVAGIVPAPEGPVLISVELEEAP